MVTLIMISVSVMAIGFAMAVLIGAASKRTRRSGGYGDSSFAWMDGGGGGGDCDSGASDGGSCDGGGDGGGGGGGD